MQIKARAVLYARFSTDLQNDRSVEDQLDLCREFSDRQGFEVTATHFDRARSGTTMHGRTGLSRLLEEDRSGNFDVVVVEALDRLSRDQEDLAAIHKRLSFAGIEIIAVHDGKADAIQIGIRGLVSTLFITDLKHKIRRGQSGNLNEGRTAGGISYGYRAVPGKPGVPEVHQPEAAIVRRIFEEYAAGRTAREIAAGLNLDSIPTQRGGNWCASSINGNRARGLGVLHNEIYAGQIVWNRVGKVRDPYSGKRIGRINPQNEWKRADAPHLRIISEDLWATVQAIIASGYRANGPQRDPRAKRLLSGYLRCGQCGGGMGMHDARGEVRRIRCTSCRESGTCQNKRRYRLDVIERAVVDLIVDRLREPDAIRSWLDFHQTEALDTGKQRAKAERRAAEARETVDRLQMNLISGRIDESFFDRQIGPARAVLATAERELDALPTFQTVTLLPSAMDDLADVLAVLGKNLPSIDPREDREMFDAFRSLLTSVTLHDTDNGGIECEVMGTIAPLTAPEAAPRGGSLVPQNRQTWIPPFTWGRIAA